LVEGVKNGRPGVTVAPPMVIYNENGSYSEELQALFSP
jgi:tRNA1(Val) A37 N6-methylase TrmN6